MSRPAIHARGNYSRRQIFGRLKKGKANPNTTLTFYSQNNQKQIQREKIYLPASRSKQAKQIKQVDKIVFVQSKRFPKIYFRIFAKHQNNVIFQQVSFPQNIKVINTSDSRNNLLYQITENIFYQINFHSFNVISGQHQITQSYHCLFSDTLVAPYSKCCHKPVQIIFMQNGTGHIQCTQTNCKQKELAQFIMNFEDAQKLWKNTFLFQEASKRDNRLKNQIARLIITGRYKKIRLKKVVQKASKQMALLFQRDRQIQFVQNNKDTKQFYPVQQDNFYLTNLQIKQQQIPLPHQQQQTKSVNNKNQQQQLLDHLSLRKIKAKSLNKMYQQLQQDLRKGIIQQGTVFQPKNQFAKLLDDTLQEQKSRKHKAAINMPRLLQKFNRTQRNISVQNKNFYKNQDRLPKTFKK